MKTQGKKIGFEWDRGNRTKNVVKHQVTRRETEEAFYDTRAIIQRDTLHSQTEERYILFGKTKGDRLIYVAFTLRGKRIRPISARDTNRREVKLYEETTRGA